MRRKYKVTGCARIFFVLIILAPLAYLGAAYYNGEDGIQNIKNFLGIGERKDPARDTYVPANDSPSKSGDDSGDIDRRIRTLEAENTALKNIIESLEEEIRQLKEQQ